VDALRDDSDIGLRTMDWCGIWALLPGIVVHMGQGGQFVVCTAEPIRFSAITYHDDALHDVRILP
jgi:hypothetical protein